MVKRIFLGMLFVLLPVVSANAQHQHTAVTPTQGKVGWNEHPELVPDSIAYQLFLLSVSVPLDATEQDRKVQASHIGKIGLDVNDAQSLAQTAANFRIQYEAWVSKWNAAAEAQGGAFDATSLLQQREDLVQSFQGLLKVTLSFKGAARLHAHIQQEKRFMN